jgi:DNA-binding NarL/FixJ family response regulator
VTGPIRVLVADDEAIVRDGLRAIIELEADLEVVAEAADGAEAVAAAAALRPDVALIDIQMPRVDGIETTRRLVVLPTPPRVLVLTTFDRNEYVYESLRAGASGFLLKDVRRGQLTDAIRTVVAGDTLLAPTITRRLIEEFCKRPSPRGGTPPELAELTNRELEVLGLLGRGLSNTEIAANMVVAQTTVKTHVAHILAKLDLRDRAQAVVTAYETGLVRAGEAPTAVGPHRQP